MADETAPTVAQDTAGVVNRHGDSTLASLFSTLADGWQTSLHDVQTLMDGVSEQANTLENALTSLGLLADMQSFTASFTRPARQYPGAYHHPRPPGTGLQEHFSGHTAPAGLPPAGKNNKPGTRATVQLLHNTLRLAVAVVQVQMLSSLLTASLVAISPNAPAQVLPRTVSHAPRPLSDSGSVWLESTPDCGARQPAGRAPPGCVCPDQLGAGLSEPGLAGAGLSRAFVADLSHRGVALSGLIQDTVTTTEPVLMTLYRISGDARDTARFIRRNRLRHPLFVPGGERMEVLGG